MRWLWGFGLGGRRERSSGVEPGGGGVSGGPRRRGASRPAPPRAEVALRILAPGEAAVVSPRRASRPAAWWAVVALGILAPGEGEGVSHRQASRPAAWCAVVALGVLAPGEGAGVSPRQASRPAPPRAAVASRILTRCRPEPSRPSWAWGSSKAPAIGARSLPHAGAIPARVGGASGSGGRWSRGAWRPESATTPAPRRQHRDARTGRGVERPGDSDALGSPPDRAGFAPSLTGPLAPPRAGPGVAGE